MAAVGNPRARNLPVPSAPSHGHQRTKSSGLKSFLHRRNNSDGSVLPSSFSTTTAIVGCQPPLSCGGEDQPLEMGLPGFSKQGRALGELQQNQLEQPPKSPKKSRENHDDTHSVPKKSAFATLSMKTQAAKEPSRRAHPKESVLSKPKKAKSVTNLAGLLSRPKSLKNLHKLATDDSARATKDKENTTPISSLGGELGPAPPIYAQFCRDAVTQQSATPQSDRLEDPFLVAPTNVRKHPHESLAEGIPLKPRPKSFQPYLTKHAVPSPVENSSRDAKKPKKDGAANQKSSTWSKKDKTSRARILTAFPGRSQKMKTAASDVLEPNIDPKDVDTHLEAMLDRRNIPENQRYKMRNLNNTIKMEFIRQDWAEAQAKTAGSPVDNAEDSQEQDKSKSKHSRVKSLTLSKGGNKTPSSPTKKKTEGTLGRHFRSKSTETVASDRPDSSSSSSSSSILSKIKSHHSASDFVSYLRMVQQPEKVEVGKLHKLRLLLRNETVAWTEEFIRQGGMKEIVGLLHRIMEIEWREEHEDALLHENLLCLKALCTTALALQYLHSIQATLLPALIHMLFDPEKKGPSEFTTRGIVTSVLFTYIQSASGEERVSRAMTVLEYLRDPETKEDERPVSFVLEMRRDRPYRVWCKEVVSVTKEVFWIFLHNLNVVALPSDRATKGGEALADAAAVAAGPATARSHPGDDQFAYMTRHFPQERPPVPAAPYVGGVEWDATNYLASHVDLLNAMVACLPGGAAARNALRAQLRISGWERCLGGSLRLCKEKFYGAVHDALRTWVAAAHDDGWDVKDVRYGPPPEVRPPRKHGGGGVKKEAMPPPRIEMPKLDFGLGSGL